MPQPPTTHVPPQNIEAEESVLGAMLVAEPALTRVIDEVKLNAADFYLDRHRAIFECAHDLYADSKPVDELSVSEALTQRNMIDQAGGKPEKLDAVVRSELQLWSRVVARGKIVAN